MLKMLDIIPFEISKKLKEIGFSYPCLAYYTKLGCLYFNNIDTYYMPNQEISLSDITKIYNLGNSEDYTDAPKIHQVLRWLVNDYNIHIILKPYYNGFKTDGSGKMNMYWKYTIYTIDNEFDPYIGSQDTNEYKTQEEAYIGAIKYIVNNMF